MNDMCQIWCQGGCRDKWYNSTILLHHFSFHRSSVSFTSFLISSHSWKRQQDHVKRAVLGNKKDLGYNPASDRYSWNELGHVIYCLVMSLCSSSKGSKGTKATLLSCMTITLVMKARKPSPTPNTERVHSKYKLNLSDWQELIDFMHDLTAFLLYLKNQLMESAFSVCLSFRFFSQPLPSLSAALCDYQDPRNS